MIKILSYRLGSSVMAILFFAITAYSQNEHPALDTVYQQDIVPAVGDEFQNRDDEESTTYYSDTLRQNFRSIVFDSVQAINTDKGFYYKRYLDSLLRATEIKEEKPITATPPAIVPRNCRRGLLSTLLLFINNFFDY